MIEHPSFERFIGATVGGYRLERLFDQGNWGAVFVARSSAETSYFLRLLPAPPQLSPEKQMLYQGRFQQEAQRIASLQHPQLLSLLDYGHYQNIPYLIYPYTTLPTLRTLLGKQGPADLLTCSRYLEQISSALTSIHQYALLHCDLSTQCIFLQENGQVLIGNVGIARLLAISREGPAPTLHTYIGSSEACAPEQLLGQPVDVYTDVYAAGAVLYRLLTAQQPFTGATREEILRQHISAPLRPVSSWRHELPQQLDSVVARALAKEPRQRYGSIDELANAYQQVVSPTASAQRSARDHATPLVLPGSPPALPTRAAQKTDISQIHLSRRRVLVTTGIGGGIAAVAALALFGPQWLTAGTTTGPVSAHLSPTASTPQAGPATPTPAAASPVLAHTADIPLNSAQTFPQANQKNPGILVHLPSDRFVAFDSTCTHAGCAVEYNAQHKLLECPCHGSAFDPARNAAVTAGPAKQPLTTIKIVVHPDGTITAG